MRGRVKKTERDWVKESPVLSASCLICGHPEGIYRRGVCVCLEYLLVQLERTLQIKPFLLLLLLLLFLLACWLLKLVFNMRKYFAYLGRRGTSAASAASTEISSGTSTILSQLHHVLVKKTTNICKQPKCKRNKQGEGERVSRQSWVC